ncbi:MAG: RdgB/HAM1 family non-canonical purine NTP pyrophosphatase [Gammaproteobacteria bacterium]|nr:RdgB/HAM1 family non-canonical purine NTP pyrophosphatase [Gammaproteobacteria bacterium]
MGATIVLASANAGKLRELASLLAPAAVELRPASDFDIPAPEETGQTFLENALLKARNASDRTCLPAIGDDSGLVVPALRGAPGIYSARFAGVDATAADNNAKLVAALDGVADRRAHFYCALVFLERADDPAPVVATGAWHGRIVDRPRGAGGFGYDPHFFVPELGATAAELAPEIKNARSHRGIAARALAQALARALDR